MQPGYKEAKWQGRYAESAAAGAAAAQEEGKVLCVVVALPPFCILNI